MDGYRPTERDRENEKDRQRDKENEKDRQRDRDLMLILLSFTKIGSFYLM
jgi:hypothetical protein